MLGDKIILNGNLCDFARTAVDVDRLLTDNYVYQHIHVQDYKALHLEQHLDIATRAYTILYGEAPELNAAKTEAEIETLLRANSYPSWSCVVRLLLSPKNRILCCHKQLIYKGYTMWHSRPKAVVVPYENPFPGCPSSSSLVCSQFATEFVTRTESNVIAITENYDRILVGAGDNPLFGVREGKVVVTPLKYGATQSVERTEGMKAAIKAGYTLEQTPILSADIPHYEELFAIDSQGVISIFSCGETTFFNIVAERVAKFHSA